LSGPVLRLTYTSPDGAKIVTSLGSDYVFLRESGSKDHNRTILADFGLKRVMQLDEADKVFSNTSMYAMADFRFAESYNRRMLRGVLAKAKIVGGPIHPFFDQQELGIATPDDGIVEFTRTPTATGGLQFVVEGKLAAAFEPSAEPLSPAEVRALSRFLRNNFTLHPDMVAAILASKAVPKEIMYLEGMFEARKERRWQLQAVERTTATYPLTAEYRSDLRSSSMASKEPLRSLLPVMLEAIAGRYQNGPRSLDSFRAAEDDALAKGYVMQHFLLDSERALQYRSGVSACLEGNVLHEDCSRQQEIIDRWKGDAPTMALLQSFGLERSNPKDAIAQRNRIERAGLSNAYMLDLWNGDTILQTGVEGDAPALFALAIKGNPYVGGFYKDLGDVFRTGFQPDAAWLCYDLARALPGGEKAPVIDGLTKMETAIETRLPEFF
jgi:hypothetical protein